MKKIFYFLLILIIVLLTIYIYIRSTDLKRVSKNEFIHNKLKLYWFIPDGLRCDPEVFNVFAWANEGKLPNIKKMMEQGSYTYSIPVFPGHTPVNFATLFTGSSPKIHGIADGPMRIEGYPLEMVSKGGFSSVARKVPAIWSTLEKNNLSSALISLPGSTPPEISNGIIVRGRWGGWGIDFPAVNFHSYSDSWLRGKLGFEKRLFYYGSPLTIFAKVIVPKDWKLDLPKSFSPPQEIKLTNWGVSVYAYIYDDQDDGIENYNAIIFSQNKEKILSQLKVGEWSRWIDFKLLWETKNDYSIYTPKKASWERALSSIKINNKVRIKIIKLGKKGFFRIRFLYDNLNPYTVYPHYIETDLRDLAGPMVDFVDNFPPQLIYYEEDKTAFLEEATMSLKWHKNIVRYMAEDANVNISIHDIYTPNQMLSSRWWLPYIDPKSPKYKDVNQKERELLQQEVLSMYQGIDSIIGEILKYSLNDTVIVFSSDHGMVPMYKEVYLNNLFAKEGLLKFHYNKDNGEYKIDWKNTKVIYLKMDNIYINPDGLDGVYKRASGEAYEMLRSRVIKLLYELEDSNGIKPVYAISKWEDAVEKLDLPQDRVGDLIVANRPLYAWYESLSNDYKIFKNTLKGGYKQAIMADKEKAMWTPFIIMGPGIRKNFKLRKPIDHIQQYPTIMRALRVDVPDFVEGKAVDELFLQSN